MTLDRVLEEIVTRDGTDYGSAEKSTEQKVTCARNQLRSELAVLLWNPELESASLVSPQHAAEVEVRLEAQLEASLESSEANCDGDNQAENRQQD